MQSGSQLEQENAVLSKEEKERRECVRSFVSRDRKLTLNRQLAGQTEKLSFFHVKHTTPIQNTDIFVFFGNQ